MKLNTSDFIDYRTQLLWNELISRYSIDVKYFSEAYYSLYSINDSHTIYASIHDPYNKASFAHELLHIELDRKDLSLPSGLLLLVKGSDYLKDWLSEALIEHFINCSNHIRMLPMFLELGFNRENFISDYGVNKLTNYDLEKLSFIKNGNVYNGSGLDFYIGKYIAVKACPNNNFNYEQSLKKLRQIEPTLFDLLDKFYVNWIDTSKIDNILFSPRMQMFDLFNALENWAMSKQIQ